MKFKVLMEKISEVSPKHPVAPSMCSGGVAKLRIIGA